MRSQARGKQTLTHKGEATEAGRTKQEGGNHDFSVNCCKREIVQGVSTPLSGLGLGNGANGDRVRGVRSHARGKQTLTRQGEATEATEAAAQGGAVFKLPL